MLSGLVQIQIFKRRRGLLKDFSERANQSLRANLCFWMTSRAFLVFANYVSAITMAVGWIIGVAVVTP